MATQAADSAGLDGLDDVLPAVSQNLRVGPDRAHVGFGDFFCRVNKIGEEKIICHMRLF